MFIIGRAARRVGRRANEAAACSNASRGVCFNSKNSFKKLVTFLFKPARRVLY